ncbi:S8 family peptidase [Alkalihalobacterium sp. APHAB7]|uniref:S8 family peptidase n=1 Tax=Alkalihalobacterium sp. APHAB7 TaxID=3402081 RepID=UPI003AAF21BC
MHKRISKSVLWLLTLALILSSFSMSALANTSSKQQAKELKIAEIFGDIEMASKAPTTVIVELKEESIVEAKHKGKKQTKQKLATERGKVISELKNKVSNAEVNREYDHVFSGFSVELPANEIPQLLTTPGVKAVYPNVEFNVTSIDEATPIDPEAFSPHMMESAPFIGSDLAWDAGFTGKGITVAIIDTGVDYTHPDLAHAFGDYKGYDFVDNNDDPQEGPGQYHGTHVAGTVAANGGIKGVAPEANLLAYRVLGPDGGTTEDVVAGIELAVKDGADIMNLSLGNTLNNPDWATSIALDWAMAEGVVAVTSNGNSGPDNWTVGSPGTSRDAISVGATQLPYKVFTAKTTSSDGVSYTSSAVQGYPTEEALLALNGQDFELVDVGYGAPADFDGKELEGKIALISRGANIAFVDKASEAKKAGAVGAVLYNNVAGSMPLIPGMAVPTIMLNQADGQALLAKVDDVTVLFDIAAAGEVGETMANFSSRGPVTSTWMIKPDVSAPGVNIVSTFPGESYAALQGTSMSAPHVAGAAALILEAHPTWGVDQVKAALMNTAEDMIDPTTGKSYAHNSQGAGSIRVLDAINTKTLVAPGSHSFGKFVKDTGRQVERQSFEIQNLSKERKRYSFEVEFTGNPDGIKVMTSNNLNVQPGKRQQVNFNVQVDTSKLKPGYYEGTIKVSDGTKTIKVPTILFVEEPDYPRVTGAFMGKEADGSYYVGSYLPGGAEVIEYDIYVYNADGTIGGFVDTIGSFENASAPIHEFNWDGTVQNGINLPKGQWVLGVYVEKAGVTEYKAYLVTKN